MPRLETRPTARLCERVNAIQCMVPRHPPTRPSPLGVGCFPRACSPWRHRWGSREHELLAGEGGALRNHRARKGCRSVLVRWVLPKHDYVTFETLFIYNYYYALGAIFFLLSYCPIEEWAIRFFLANKKHIQKSAYTTSILW